MSVKILGDLRECFGGARDQGQRPTCIAFAISDAHAAGRNTNSFEALSVEYLFYHGVLRTKQKNPYRGISLKAASDALGSEGQPEEHIWPYLEALPTNLATWKPPHVGELHRAGVLQKYQSAQMIRESIDQGQPLLAVLKLTESFYTPNNDGVIEIRNPDSDTAMHAVILVGHGKLEGVPMFMVRNSWGCAWGMQGYAWLYEDYLMPRLDSVVAIN